MNRGSTQRSWCIRGATQRLGHLIAIMVLFGAVVRGAYAAEHVAVLELGGAGEGSGALREGA